MSDNSNHTLSKVKDIEELAEVVSAARALGKRIVHCHGVFDLMHVGHIRHLDRSGRGVSDLRVWVVVDVFRVAAPHHCAPWTRRPRPDSASRRVWGALASWAGP